MVKLIAYALLFWKGFNMMSSVTTKRRDKGEGSKRLRKYGRYEYRYVAGRRPDGKAIYKSFTAKTERELNRKIKEYNEDRTKYIVKAEATMFRDYAEFWMKTVKYPILKPVSYDRLEQTYNTVCNYIGWIQLGSVSTEDIQSMINDLSATKAYSTVKKHYEFVKGVFQYAYNSQKITFDPCPAVQLPIERNMKVKTKKTEILPENITEKMYEFNNTLQQSNNQFFKHAPVLLLILNTGMRIGEALALEWNDVDFKNKTLRINKTLTKAKERDEKGEVVGKNKKTFSDITKTESGNRLIPLNDMATSLLMQIQDYNKRKKIKTDYVACTADGGYVSERNILRTYKSILGLVGAEDYTIHALRHTFASRLLKGGIEISVVSKLLGHADINTTYSTYIHVLSEQMTDVMSSICKV